MPAPKGYYQGQSVFWQFIRSLTDGEFVDFVDLYQRGLYRLADSATWTRDEIARRTAALASTSVGAPAIVIGSADLSALVYDQINGDLNSKDIQVQTDNSGVKSVTFGLGPTAPTSPADVVASILNITGNNPVAYIDAASHLNLASVTTGGTGTITIIGGSALPLLGFATNQSATGKTTGNSGDSLIGVGAITGTGLSFPGGPLRSFLLSIADNITPALQVPQFVADGPNMTIDGSSKFWLLDAPTVARAVIVKATMPSGFPPRDGQEITIKRPAKGAFVYSLKNEANQAINIATFTSSISTSADLYWSGKQGKWNLKRASVGANSASDSD
jgi:hypothetical protein